MDKRRILFLALGIAFVLGAFALKYIWKDVDDFSKQTSIQSFNFNEMIELANSTDSNKINSFKEKLITVNGFAKKITIDSNNTTIEIGDSSSLSSIICQMDKRHLSELTSVKEMSPISIKGKLNGINKDDEMGLGTTVELNYCILNK
jgi:hypothetical protein